MIDPIQIPILLKAIDFIFEEGHKILEERRERRRANAPAQEQPGAQPAGGTPPPEVHVDPAMKPGLLTARVDERLWQNHEQEVQHLVRLLETHSRNYRVASEQYAKWGSALVPPIIVHNLTEAENSIVETLRKLEAVLSNVYKKDINLIQHGVR